MNTETGGPQIPEDSEAPTTGSPDLLAAIFDGSPDAIVVADSNGNYLAANEAAAEVFGLSPSELIGRNVAEFAPEGYDTDSVFATFLADGSAIGQFTIVRGDGSVRYVEYHARANFAPGAHMSVLRDITGRDRILQNLRQSEEQLARTLYANPVPMAVSAFETERFVLVNESFLRLTGHFRADLVGETVKSIAADPGEFASIQEQLKTDGVSANRELRLRRKDGAVIVCHVSFAKFEIAAGSQMVIAVTGSSPAAG